MPVTETYTASLYSRYYNNPDEGTRQGVATHGTWDGLSWVGMIVIPANLTGKKITAITINVTANTAGTNARKQINFYSSNHQNPDEPGKGYIFPNERLFYVSAPIRDTSLPINLTGEPLDKTAEYFSSGGQMLVLYDPSGNEDNYCRFTSVSITVTYEGANGTVKYKVDGEWVECKVYYRTGGQWVECIPHIMQNGVWEKCSH